MKLPRNLLLVPLLAATLAGCANPSHLVFVQSAVVGADASANTETGQIHVALGYDRQTNAIIPKTKVQTAGGEVNEAMSVISASDIRIKWLGVHEVNEQFATGQAAVNMADNPATIGEVLTLTRESEAAR